MAGAQTPVSEDSNNGSCLGPPGSMCGNEDPDCMKGYVGRCGTSGQIHSSEWSPGLHLVKLFLPREKGKLTTVLRFLRILRTSEWKGCAPFVRNDSFTSHVFLGTCFGSDPMWTQAMVGGEVPFWRSRPGPQVWDCSAATFSSDQNTSLARKAWGGRTGLAKLQECLPCWLWKPSTRYHEGCSAWAWYRNKRCRGCEGGLVPDPRNKSSGGASKRSGAESSFS